MRGIILAGGKGSRLHPLTRVTNKHLLPVGREPMLYHPLRQLVGANITEILVVTSVEHMGAIVDCLGSGAEFDCELTYRVQETAGGIAHALALAERFANGERIAVILGDNVFERSIAPYAEHFRGGMRFGARIVLAEVEDPGRYGVAVVSGPRVVSMRRSQPIPSQPTPSRVSTSTTGTSSRSSVVSSRRHAASWRSPTSTAPTSRAVGWSTTSAWVTGQMRAYLSRTEKRTSYFTRARIGSCRMSKRMLVTGGAGFIGSNFVHYMLAEHSDVEIVTLDLLTYAGSMENLDGVDQSRHRLIHGDINDTGLVRRLLATETIDTIVHLAAETHVDRSIAGPTVFVATNVCGTFTLLEAVRLSGRRSASTMCRPTRCTGRWLSGSDRSMKHLPTGRTLPTPPARLRATISCALTVKRMVFLSLSRTAQTITARDNTPKSSSQR